MKTLKKINNILCKNIDGHNVYRRFIRDQKYNNEPIYAGAYYEIYDSSKFELEYQSINGFEIKKIHQVFSFNPNEYLVEIDNDSFYDNKLLIDKLLQVDENDTNKLNLIKKFEYGKYIPVEILDYISGFEDLIYEHKYRKYLMLF